MYAGLTTIVGSPERLEDAIRDYQKTILPALQKLAGFKGTYLLVDRKSGKGIGVTLWTTEKEARNAEAAFRSYVQQGRGIERFEVAVAAEPVPAVAAPY